MVTFLLLLIVAALMMGVTTGTVYCLSPYHDAARVPTALEKRLLYLVAAYPPAYIIFLLMADILSLPGVSPPDPKHHMFSFAVFIAGHALLSSMGTIAAYYLYRCNRYNLPLLVINILAGLVYFIFIMVMIALAHSLL